MKLKPVAKPDKKNKATSKKIEYDSISENCDNIPFFQFRSIWSNPDAGFRIVCKTYTFINSNLLSCKN